LLALLMCLSLFIVSCSGYDEVRLSIESPQPGQMIPAGAPVEVKIVGLDSSLNGLLVDGAPPLGFDRLSADTMTIYRDPINGLGFLSAARTGDPYIVVRSWLQGTFVESDAWYSENMILRLGHQALNLGESSLANLIKMSLLDVDLGEFIDPIRLDLGIASGQILIDQAYIRDMSLSISTNSTGVFIDLTLAPLELSYRVESRLVNSQGEGLFEHIHVTADSRLSPDGITLVNVELEAAQVRLTDDVLPSEIVNIVADVLKNQFDQAIKNAIEEVTYQVSSQFFRQLRPTLGIALTQPITNLSQLSSVQVNQGALEIGFSTKVFATAPQKNSQGGGALSVPLSMMRPINDESSFIFGAGLINQIAYAAWDAGNFTDLVYTRQRLESLGLGSLSSPYDQLDRAIIELLLPPIIEWRFDGAYLALGGVSANLKIDVVKDTRVTTAVRAPITMTFQEGQVRVISDPRRAMLIEDVMLDRLTTFADRAEVIKLIQTSVPAVINDILGSFPLVSISPLTLRALEGSPVIELSPQLRSLNTDQALWLMGVDLNAALVSGPQ